MMGGVWNLNKSISISITSFTHGLNVTRFHQHLFCQLNRPNNLLLNCKCNREHAVRCRSILVQIMLKTFSVKAVA